MGQRKVVAVVPAGPRLCKAWPLVSSWPNGMQWPGFVQQKNSPDKRLCHFVLVLGSAVFSADVR